MGVERRSIHRLIARAAGPGGVAAAVAEARLVANEHLIGAELVTVRASRRRVGDPLAVRGLYEITEHNSSLGSTANNGRREPVRRGERRPVAVKEAGRSGFLDLAVYGRNNVACRALVA